MPSTTWPRDSLLAAQADEFTRSTQRMLDDFRERWVSEAAPAPKPAPFTLPDLASLTPWAQPRQETSDRETADGKAAGDGFTLPTLASLTPWAQPKTPAPESRAVTTVSAPSIAGSHAPSGQPQAMPSVGEPGPGSARIAGAGTRASRFAAQIDQVAREEGVPADVLAAILDTEDSGETSVSVDGARGLMQVVPGQGFDLPGEDASDPLTSIRQGARALKEKYRMAGGDWSRAGGLYFGVGSDSLGNTSDVYQQRYDANRARYGAGEAPQHPEAPSGQPQAMPAQASSQYSAGEYTPNQIEAATAEGLDYETALAVCGPAAAIAFARKNGRNPTMSEAVNLAKQVGWTAAQGMAGPASQQRLLQHMGIAARLVDGTPDWRAVAADVQRGNPVMLSTPGHYFVAERYDPDSGAFDFGSSAAVLRASGGRRWFRPEELPSLGMGDARATLYMDSPQTPAPSVVAGQSQYKAGELPEDGGPSAGDQKRAIAASGTPEEMPTAPTKFGQPIVPVSPDTSLVDVPQQAPPFAGRRTEVSYDTGTLNTGASDRPPDAPASPQQDGPPPAAPAGGAPDGMWSPDEPATPIAQMSDGRRGGGIMYRQPIGAPTMGDTATGDEQPYDPDQGAHESGYTVPAAGAKGVAGTPPRDTGSPAAPSTYNDPTDDGTIHQPLPPPTPQQPTAIQAIQSARSGQDDELAPRDAQPGLIDRATAPARDVYGRALDDVNQQEDEAHRRNEEAIVSELGRAITAPVEAIRRGVRLATAIIQATPEATAETVNAALETIGLGREQIGIDLPLVGRVGIGDAVLNLAPNRYVQVAMMGGAPLAHGGVMDAGVSRAGNALASLLPDVATPIEARAGALTSAAGQAVRGAGRRIGEALDANAARAGEQGAMELGSGFVPQGNPYDVRNLLRSRVIPPDLADTLDFPVRIPDDPNFASAVRAAGGSIDPERGVDLGVTRAQGPEAAGRTATRGGVFYEAVPPGGRSSYVAKEGSQVGGSQVIPREPTRFRSPLVLSDAPGAHDGFNEGMQRLGVQAPPTFRVYHDGMEQYVGGVFGTKREAQQFIRENNLQGGASVSEMRSSDFSQAIDAAIETARSAGPAGSPQRSMALKRLVKKYGGDPSLIDDLLKVRGLEASESAWAIKENVLAHNARRAGYDGAVTVQSSRPHEGVAFHPDDKFEIYDPETGDLLAGAPTEAKAKALAEELGWTHGDEDSPYPLDVRPRTPSARITELADFREGASPVPGASREVSIVETSRQLDEARQQWRDLAAQFQSGGGDRAQVAEAMDAAMARVAVLEREYDTILREGTLTLHEPSQYTLRPDIRRRGPDISRESVGAGVIPRPGTSILPTLQNAAQGGVLGAASEDLQAQAEGREPDPTTRLARAGMGAGLAVLAGRRMGRGGGGHRLGAGVVPEGQSNPAVVHAAQHLATNPAAPPAARRVARGIQQAAAGPNAQNPVPGLPMPPPQAPPGFWDWAQTWRYGVSLFGQLSTAMMQTLGGLGEVGIGVPTELARQIIRGHPEHLPIIGWEALKSVPHGLSAFAETAAGKVPQTILQSSDYRPPLSDRLTGMPKGVALALETPGRVATQAPDALWYEMFYRTGLAQAASEQAGRGVQNLRALIANPTPEMVQRAHQLAQDATYKGDLGALATIGETVIKGPSAQMVSGLPPEAQRVFAVYREIASHFMPVYHTIARITEGGAGYVPGVGALPLEKVGLAAKATPLDERVAKQATGLALTLGLLSYAAAGGVRGPGPSDPDVLQEMRDQGYEPNTTNIGGVWVPNSALGRPGVILNMVGALNDAIVYGTGKESWGDLQESDPHFSKRINLIVSNLGRAWSDYPTASAVTSLAKLAKNPVEALSEFAGEAGAQYVPGLVRTVATATDTKARRPDRADDEAPLDRAVDTFKQRSGVGRQSLPVAQDRLGREVENQRQGWAAIFPRVGRDRPDPVIQTFIDNKVEIPKKREKITVDGLEIPLTPAQQRRWQQLMGEFLLKEVPKTTTSQFWNRPTTTLGDRADELRDLTKEAAEDASDRIQDLIGKQELDRLLREAERTKAKQRGEPMPAGR